MKLYNPKYKEAMLIINRPIKTTSRIFRMHTRNT